MADEVSPPSLDATDNALGASGMAENGPVENRGVKRARQQINDDDDDDDDSKPGRERRKIEIKFIQDKSRRHITFSKRKAGIMKKAYELSVLTGTQVLLLVVSETGLVYTFTTPKLQPLVTKAEGKNLIQACLNAPEPGPHSSENGVADGEQYVESPEEPPHAQLPPHNAQRPVQLPVTGYSMGAAPLTAEQQAAYQSYINAQQNHAARGHYMPGPGQMQNAHPQQPS